MDDTKTGTKTKRKGPQRPPTPNLKHGGEAAVKALTTGEPFHGPAIVVQAEVEQDYAQGGAAEMILEQAVRLTSASRLYWQAIQAASQQGASIAVLDGYVARAGWLAGASVRAWQAVKANERQKNAALVGVLEDYANDSSE